ncbi:hypothetical protein FPRO05_00849 [Fusarium proliferatum]|uniref:F-box domain-containing protein n=1 Tax=Gibberella intermedia TaxID=948311 RepID=A0A365NPG9_GIBIN|nr:hypothetical protein FPRO05_00849 [Fusarium proliferatum]
MWPNGFSTYDPDVVSDADVEWLDQVHFLGYNPLATTSSKFYVSDPAIIGRGIEMATETRTDPAFAGVEVRTLRVYRNKKGPERVIPFHWECYKTLALYLTGTSDTTRIRKGALYRVLDRFSVVRDFQRQAALSEYRCLSLDYGDSNKAQKDYWECIPGQEYTIFSPKCQVQMKDDIAAHISGPEFEKPSQYLYKVKASLNPLTLLPETVISGVSEFLDNESLINLFCASLETYSSLRDSGSFWKRRIVTHLPYFLELHEYLKENSQNLENRDFRKIFLWADAASKPRSGVTRLMFPVANRRRIWKVHLTDGSEHTYGQGDEHLLRMPFAATENMAIVGIKGTLTAHKRHAISPFIEKVRFLQAATNGEHFSREPLKHRDQEVTSRSPVNCMFRNLISPTDDLELNLCKGRVRNFDRWHCLVPLNTLVLANDASELSQIRSISAYIIRDPICFNIWNNHCCDVGNLRITTDTETRYLRNMDDDGSIWPGHRWDTFHIDGPGGEIIEKVIVHHALFRDPSPKAIETCTNRGRSVIWGVDMERGEYGDETNKPCPPNMSHRLPTHLRPDDGFTIVGLTMGCGKVFGRWHSDEYQVERIKAPECHSYSRRLKDKGEDYVDEKDSRGPWTKEQYDRRNESTIHTGMSKFGIITKRITDNTGQGN